MSQYEMNFVVWCYCCRYCCNYNYYYYYYYYYHFYFYHYYFPNCNPPYTLHSVPAHLLFYMYIPTVYIYLRHFITSLPIVKCCDFIVLLVSCFRLSWIVYLYHWQNCIFIVIVFVIHGPVRLAWPRWVNLGPAYLRNGPSVLTAKVSVEWK